MMRRTLACLGLQQSEVGGLYCDRGRLRAGTLKLEEQKLSDRLGKNVVFTMKTLLLLLKHCITRSS